MNTHRTRVTVALSAVAVLTAGSGVAPASSHTAVRNVLALYWSTEDFPSNAAIDAALRETLLSQRETRIDYFSEFLESDRLPVEDATEALREYIARKYRQRHIDVVIAISEVAQQFALQHRVELFPDAPIVFSRVAAPTAADLEAYSEQTGIVSGAAYAETLTLALSVHPGTREVFVIGGAPSESFLQDIKSHLDPLAHRVKLTYVTNVPVPQMLEHVRTAPSDSLVLYIRYSQELGGQVLFPDAVAAMVVAASPVPVYVTRDRYMGGGAIGGEIRDSRTIGLRTGALALQILRGTRARDIPIERAGAVATFDWRQLQRWRVDLTRIPQDARILYKLPTTWESYRSFIIGALLVFAGQVALIGALLTQHARRRRAEHAIRTREAKLRKSYERIRQLNGRLLSAQEAARADIARELHDDVCQELVGVSLTVAGLKRSSSRVRDSHVQKSLSQLELTVLGILDGLRRLSHDLHPATLKLVGLAAALRTHCIEVERRHDVQVAFEALGPVGQVHPDIALCLFRIAQEALRNGAVHGDARRLTVSILRSTTNIDLIVTDDGRGFDVERARQEGRGLGLTSMEERVHLIGGDVQIVSGADSGTTIRVRLPIAHTADATTHDVVVHVNMLADSEAV